MVIVEVDGHDAPVRAETIEMSSRRLADDRRPYRLALVLAVITAAVALGALGPRAVAVHQPEMAVACESAHVAPDPTATPAAMAWWQHPSQRVWVDPRTGATRQSVLVTGRQVMDHRARVQ